MHTTVIHDLLPRVRVSGFTFHNHEQEVLERPPDPWDIVSNESNCESEGNCDMSDFASNRSGDELLSKKTNDVPSALPKQPKPPGTPSFVQRYLVKAIAYKFEYFSGPPIAEAAPPMPSPDPAVESRETASRSQKGGKGDKKKNPWETDSDESSEDENGFVADRAHEVILNF